MQFTNLLKKELKQLITVQALATMGITLLLFIFMGQIMNSTTSSLEEAVSSKSITVADMDKTDFTAQMFENLREREVEVTFVDVTLPEDGNFSPVMEEKGLSSLTVLPKGFTEQVEKGEKAEIQFISTVSGVGLSSMVDSAGDSWAVSCIYDYVGEYIADKDHGVSSEELEYINSPLMTVELTVANGKTAEVSPSSVSGIMMAQSFAIPFAVFIIVMMGSSSIMTAISTEKIDKTLETLLSSPVSRISVLLAKMAAAVISALLNSVVMGIGMVFYMGGVIGNAAAGITTELEAAPGELGDVMNLAQAVSFLGLSITPGQAALVVLEIFIAISIGLCMALILGALATDAQSLSTLMLPVMLLIMIPFFVSVFLDVNTLGTAGKIFLYIIPFTHAYAALGNLMFGHTLVFWAGLAYQVVFLGILMFAAVKIFTSDLLFTMRLPTGQARGKKQRA